MIKLKDKIILILETINNWKYFEEYILNHQSHEGQLDFLLNSIHKENLLHAGNGFGKTDIIAKKHIKFVLKHFDNAEYKTLNAAITSDQSQLVMERIKKISENSPILKGWFINSVVKYPNAQIRYSNGAITEFKTTKKKGEAIEGKEYGYISVDEIALERHLEFLRETILLPRLRAYNDSQLDFFATPKGQNAFYRIAMDIQRKGGYVRAGSSYENPYIDHKLLDYYKKSWTQNRIEQVIYGKFIDSSEAMFAGRIDSILCEDDTITDDIDKNYEYIEGWDLARGRKGSNSDQTVGFRLQKISKDKYIITNRWQFQLPWTQKSRENVTTHIYQPNSSVEEEIRRRQKESNSKVFIDSTGAGDVLWEIIADIAKPVNFAGSNKDKLLDNLQAVMDSGMIQTQYIPELIDEMTTYTRNDTGLDTDNLMALAVACSSIKPFELKKAVATIR